MREAGERGDLEAQKALGRFYLTGLEEMGSDPTEAERWLSIAAGRGDTESQELLEQARSAKKKEQAYYAWKQHWQPIYYGYWYRSYAYRYNWTPTGWVYHP
jgi:TPR repeat protein